MQRQLDVHANNDCQLTDRPYCQSITIRLGSLSVHQLNYGSTQALPSNLELGGNYSAELPLDVHMVCYEYNIRMN